MHRKIGISSVLLIGILVVLIPMSVSCSGIIKKAEKFSPTYQETPVLQGWKTAPVSKEFSSWLKENGSAVMLFVTKDGQVRVSNIEGQEVRPCGKLVGTSIEGECKQLKGVTIENLLQTSTIITSGSPRCITINFMGTLVQIDPQTGRLCGQ